MHGAPCSLPLIVATRPDNNLLIASRHNARQSSPTVGESRAGLPAVPASPVQHRALIIPGQTHCARHLRRRCYAADYRRTEAPCESVCVCESFRRIPRFMLVYVCAPMICVYSCNFWHVYSGFNYRHNPLENPCNPRAETPCRRDSEWH